MSGFDTTFMWRPRTSEQSAQFAGEMAKNAWIPVAIVNPPAGAVVLAATASAACTSPTTTKDVYVSPDNKPQVDAYEDSGNDSHPLIDMLGDVFSPDQKDCYYDCGQRDLLTDAPDGDEKPQDAEVVDELNEGKLTDLDGTSQPDEVAQPDLPDEISQGDETELSDASEVFDLVDVTPDLVDTVEVHDTAPDVGDTGGEIIDPPSCYLENPADKFLVLNAYADVGKLQPLSAAEFMVALTPATVPSAPIYIALVVYNAGETVLPEDENGIKLCYHDVGTCTPDTPLPILCATELDYLNHPVVWMYGWDALGLFEGVEMPLAQFQVITSTSQEGLTIYAVPTDVESCYSVFNTFSCGAN